MKIKSCFNEISLDWLLLGKGNMLLETVSPPSSNVIEHQENKGSFSENEVGGLFDSQIEADISETESTENESGFISGNSQELRKLTKVILLFNDGSFSEYKK